MIPRGLENAWILPAPLAVLFPPAAGGVPEGISQLVWLGQRVADYRVETLVLSVIAARFPNLCPE